MRAGQGQGSSSRHWRWDARRSPAPRTAAVRYVGLNHTGGAFFKKVAKGMDTNQSFSRSDRCSDRTLNKRDVFHGFRPAWLLQKIKSIRLERLGKLHPHARTWPGMAINHDVNFVANGLTHGFDASLGVTNWVQKFATGRRPQG